MTTPYPEHEKMSKVQPAAQIIGEFLEWLLEETPLYIAEHEKFSSDRLVPTRLSIEQLIARHFDIDLNKIKAEKDQMLDDIRSGNANLGPGVVGG